MWCERAAGSAVPVARVRSMRAAAMPAQRLGEEAVAPRQVECQLHDPRKPTHSGVLEFLAQSTMVSSARYDRQWDWQDSFQVVREEMKIPPRIIQDSSGSTTFRCLETCGDSWDSGAIKNFAATSGTIIVNEMPDRGSSMIKLKHARAAEFATCQNVLYDEDGS